MYVSADTCATGGTLSLNGCVSWKTSHSHRAG
jgi:hypothetical protein